MEYLKDWKYNKFTQYLIIEEHKERLYQLYKTLDEPCRKRLFLYIINEDSRKYVRELLNMGGLLTIKGIDNYLLEKDLYQNKMVFQCQECGHTTSHNKFILVKCQNCEDGKYKFINKEEVLNTFNKLYLDYFNFYLINDNDRTLYLIENKYNGKYYLKSSDEALTTFIYLKLIGAGCEVSKYMFAMYGGGKSMKHPKKCLFQYLQDSVKIKNMDDINFKPIKDKIFKEDGKKFFNIYSGNKYLNQNIVDNDYVFKRDCPNILELMYNLTGKNNEGVEYLLDVLAMMLQKPQIKTKQLIIFYGEEAAGKGTFYDFILYPLFEGYITKILGKKIKSSFNGFMSKNLALVLEEVKSDKEEEDTLKELVTEEKILINEKNRKERYENSYLTVFGFSNEQNPISAGKRRGVYFRSRTLGGSISKAPLFRRKYEEFIPQEFEKFVALLKTREVDIMKVMRGVETDAKRQVLDQNKSVIERFYDEICCYPNLVSYDAYLIDNDAIDPNDILLKHKYTSKNVEYVDANYILNLYNNYLKKNKYAQVSLNKFSEFWQLVNIDRENKDHWRRLKPNGKKVQYVNLEHMNKEINMRYEEDD